MNREDLFDLWAPPDSPWSVWAKPVLFADMNYSTGVGGPVDPPRVANFPLPPGTAVVVDVEGSNSVVYGLALAKAGYRPVPLFNSGIEAGMLVNMRSVADYLLLGAETLQGCSLGPDAPPAFLLNADRLDNSGFSNQPGRYDNRWCVVAQDMPSAHYLQEMGIRQVVLVASQIRDDLSHILLRYQEAGLPILRTPDVATPPQSVTVTKPPFYKSLIYRSMVYMGLRRNAAGGFGAVVPNPSTGVYGGFG